MKKKFKLALLDNYVAIYRLLLECKSLINQNLTEEDLIIINKICNETIKLKKEHEKTFHDCNMIDNAFTLLKQQLDDSLEKNQMILFNKAKLKNMLTQVSNLENIHKDICIKLS